MLTLASLKPPQNTGETKASRTTGTGGPAAPRKPTKSFKSFEKQRKAYQYPPELIQEPPGIIHDLTELLFSRFGKTKASTKPRARTPARTRRTNHRINPSDRIAHEGAIEISRSDLPPTSESEKLPVVVGSHSRRLLSWKVSFRCCRYPSLISTSARVV